MKTTPVLATGLLALTLAAAPTTPSQAWEAGDFLVRVRGIAVVPDESGSTRPLNANVNVSNAGAPEIDLTYFLTKNIAFELIAATTQHELSADGNGLGNNKLGTVWVLPPTLTAQYHFFPDEVFRPYVGAGINYTVFYAEDTTPPFSQLNVNNSIGYALQAGIDIQIPENPDFFFNLDFKYIFMSPNANVRLGGTKIRTQSFDLNPMIFGVGFGYKF